MSTVYVLNKDGKPLMPTTRCGHVRRLLKEQKAQVVTSKPFTIQLLYETDDVVQPLYLGIDPGRTNIGVAVVKIDGTAVFTAHLETRNKEIPKLMQGRKKARRARRTNGRCRSSFWVDGFLFCEYSDSVAKRADFTSSLIFCGMISSSLILCGQLHSRANCIQWELENKKSDARMYLQ